LPKLLKLRGCRKLICTISEARQETNCFSWLFLALPRRNLSILSPVNDLGRRKEANFNLRGLNGFFVVMDRSAILHPQINKYAGL
jgi:hypothetical protein